MNMDLELELSNFLETDSDFIQALCQQLEDDGIHLNNDLLTRILHAYEERKTDILKGFLENVLGHEDLPFPTEGSSIIHMVMDGPSRKQERNDKNLEILDTDIIM